VTRQEFELRPSEYSQHLYHSEGRKVSRGGFLEEAALQQNPTKPTPVFLPGKSKDRGAWWATIRGVANIWT